MKKIYHLLFLILSFFNVNAQEQITNFQASIKQSLTRQYKGSIGDTAIFVSNTTNSESILYFVVSDTILFTKTKPGTVVVSNGKLKLVTNAGENTFNISSVSLTDFSVRQEATIKDKDAIFWGKYIFYNRENRFYKFDVETLQEEKVFDQKGVLETSTLNSTFINVAGTSISEDKKNYRFPNGSNFTLKAGQEITEVTKSEDYILIWVKEAGIISMYTLGKTGMVKWPAVSDYKNTFVTNSEQEDYLIQVSDFVLNKGRRIVVSNINKQELIDYYVPLNFYFTATNIFGGRTDILYSKPAVVNQTLYMLGSKRLNNYLSPILDKSDLVLLKADLTNQGIDTLSAAEIVPRNGFRNALAYGESLYSLDSNLTWTLANTHYKLENNRFTKLPDTYYHFGRKYNTAEGSHFSYDDTEVTFWAISGDKINTLKFPESRALISGYRNYSKGQEFLWISHRNDDKSPEISFFDGNELKHLYTGEPNQHFGQIIPLESQNRIDGQSVVIMFEASQTSFFTFDYSTKKLQFIGKVGESLTYSLDGIYFQKHSENLLSVKLYNQSYAFISGNTVKLESVIHSFKSSYISRNSKDEVYYVNQTDSIKIEQKYSFWDGVGNDKAYYFINNDGFHVINENGVLKTIEPFNSSGLSAQLKKVSTKYIVTRVNGKMYLTDLETGESDPSILPFESSEGYRYFIKGNKLFGISNDNFSLYSYDLKNKRFAVVKQFVKTNTSRLEGTDNLFYFNNGVTEIWKVSENNLEKVFEIRGRLTSSDLRKVQFVKLEDNYVYWNPFLSEAVKMEKTDLDLENMKWLDSLGDYQIFASGNSLWAYYKNNLQNIAEFETAYFGQRVKIGKTLYFQAVDQNRKNRLWKTDGLKHALVSDEIEVFSVLFKQEMVDYKNSIYLSASFAGLTQLWKVNHIEEPLVLANEIEKINFSFYPNPTHDFVNISSSSETTEKYKIRIFSSEGKLLNEHESSLPKKLDLSYLDQGVYLINVISKYSDSTFRLIKI